MKNITVSAIVIGALSAPLCSVQPAMAYSVQYVSVCYPPQGGTRYPRTRVFDPIPGTATQGQPIMQSPVGLYINITQSQSDTFGSPPLTCQLAYVNITGGIGGSVLVRPDYNGPVSVPVQIPAQQDINVEYVYLPEPTCAGPSCGTAAVFDEYDETTGTLVDDTFANIFIPSSSTTVDPNNTQDNAAGSVGTANNSVRISALNPPNLVPTDTNTANGGSFDRWVPGPNGTIGGPNSSCSSSEKDLCVDKGQSNYLSLALYRDACPDGYQLPSSQSPITQCQPVTCPPGEIFNNGAGACLSTCEKGYAYNPITKKCNSCPIACRYGCNVLSATDPTNVCKKPPSSGTTLQEILQSRIPEILQLRLPEIHQ